jgi:hypothetical protein
MFYNSSNLKRSLVSLLTLAALIGTSDVVFGSEYQDENVPPKKFYSCSGASERPTLDENVPPRKYNWNLIMPEIEFVQVGELKLKESRKSKKQDDQAESNAAETALKTQQQNEERAKRRQNRNGKNATVVEPENVNPQGKKRTRAKKQPTVLAEKEPLNQVAQSGMPILEIKEDKVAISNASAKTGNKFPKRDIEALDLDAIELAIQKISSKPIMSLPPAMEIPESIKKAAAISAMQPRVKLLSSSVEELQDQLREPTKMNPNWIDEKQYFKEHFHPELYHMHAYVIGWVYRVNDFLKLIEQYNGDFDLLQQRMPVFLDNPIVYQSDISVVNKAAERFKDYEEMRTLDTPQPPVYKSALLKDKEIGFKMPEKLSHHGALHCLHLLQVASGEALRILPPKSRHAQYKKHRFYVDLNEQCKQAIDEFNAITTELGLKK